MSETWRLDRLVLQGFKSFADRTLLDFPDPVTGIIGPNGSGKSNLVEAIRFVTGSTRYELDDGTQVSRAVTPQLSLFIRFADGETLSIHAAS